MMMTAPPKTIEGGLVGGHTHTHIQTHNAKMGLSNWEMFVHFFLSTGEQSTILNMTTTPKSWLSSQGWFLSTLC